MCSTSSTMEMVTAQKLVQNQCEDIWTHVNQIYTELSKEKPLNNVATSENQMFEVCKAKEKQLAAEVDVLKNFKVEGFPTDSTTLRVQLQHELKSSVSQLEQTLDIIQTQRKQLEEELTREKGLLERHKEVHRSLLQKLQAAKWSCVEGSDSEEGLAGLTRKQQCAEEMEQELMRSLARFTTKHFPLPSVADVNKTSKRRSSNGSTDDQHQYISLLEILEVLMNKCIDVEPDPYVALDESFWPPYVELLLRCGIAVRHPQACQYIKLVPFHL